MQISNNMVVSWFFGNGMYLSDIRWWLWNLLWDKYRIVLMVCRLYLYYENARDFGSTINEQQIYFEQISQDIFLCQDLWDDLQEGII